MKIAFMTFNFFDYEYVLPVPKGVPEYMETVYLTDTIENAGLAVEAGWKEVFCVRDFVHIADNFGKRRAIGAIKTFPEAYVQELGEYDKIFMTDPNTLVLDSNYSKFVESFEDKYTLCITTGYWKQTGMWFELTMSLGQPRWQYNAKEMTDAYNRYVKELGEYGALKCPLVSARYIGWNMKNKKTNDLAQIYLQESNAHIQGNMILTYLYAKCPDMIFAYGGFLNDGANTGHKRHGEY